MDLERLKKNLILNGYNVSIFDNRVDAVNYIDANVDRKTIGFGGSLTIEEIGLMDKLSMHNEVLYRFNNKDNKSPDQVMKEQLTSDIYFSSVNAISETGEIVNIDGRCNRISAINYGHEKVYLILGINKICANLEDAVFRARNIAAPLNAKRLNKKTPCALKGNKCYDCDSPERICRVCSIMFKKPSGCEFEVIIINEKLGF